MLVWSANINGQRNQEKEGEIMKNHKKMSAIEKTKTLINKNLSGEKEITVHHQLPQVIFSARKIQQLKREGIRVDIVQRMAENLMKKMEEDDLSYKERQFVIKILDYTLKKEKL